MLTTKFLSLKIFQLRVEILPYPYSWLADVNYLRSKLSLTFLVIWVVVVIQDSRHLVKLVLFFANKREDRILRHILHWFDEWKH